MTRDDGTPEVYSLAGDDRPAAELVSLSETLSTRQVNTAGVIQGLGPAGFRTAWGAVRPKFASEWSIPPVEGSDWDRWCVPQLAGQTAFQFQTFQTRTSTERTGQYLWHLDRLVVGTGARPVWIIARQHPGETMAEWFVQGLLQRLLDPADAVSRELRRMGSQENRAYHEVKPQADADPVAPVATRVAWRRPVEVIR